MNAAEFLKTLRTLRRRHGKQAGVNLTPVQLTQRWRGAYSERTLANWRAEKGTGRRGPAFARVAGRVVYPIDGVELFEEQMLSLIAEGKR